MIAWMATSSTVDSQTDPAHPPAAPSISAAASCRPEPIAVARAHGQFQALKHMAADVLVEVETALSAAYYALGAVAADDDEVPVVAPLAAAYCTDAYVTAAHQNVQFHGGMGFTWELPAHLYFKRARSGQLLFGEPARHRARVAERQGI